MSGDADLLRAYIRRRPEHLTPAMLSALQAQPERRETRRHVEEDIQRAIAQFLDAAVGPRAWFHPPNGGWRSKREAAIMSGLGVKPGVPDIVIIAPPPALPGRCGAALELKAPGNRPTADQREWIEAFRAHGRAAEWKAGLDAAIAWLRDECGYGRGRRP